MHNGRQSYAGELALVIGGTGGIGREFVREFTDHGADVALTYFRRADEAQAAIRHAAERGQRCLAYSLDLSDATAIAHCADQLVRELGVPTIVVNCAGLLRDRLIAMMNDDDWDAVLDVNLSGPFRLLRRLAPEMARRRSGRIINIASVAGLFGVEGQVNYAASKGGLIALTRALARELGPFSVSVNAVAPGLIETHMTSQLSELRRRRLLERIPARRFGTPADVVAAARLLLHSDVTYVTGHVLIVDGGLTA